MANLTKRELRPLPMRITQLQFERLQGARTRDGLSIQEHVRRALDAYLSKVEREADKATQPTAPVKVGTPYDFNAPGNASLVASQAAGIAVPPARPPAPRVRTR